MMDFTTKAPQVVAASLVMMLLIATAEAQLFYRVPKTEDSCQAFKFTSSNQRFAQWIARLQFGKGIDCGDNYVVNSAGECVMPTDPRLDRCFPTALTDQEVALRCAQNSNLRFADPTACNTYYDCSKGAPYKATCPTGELYNDVKKECDLFPLVHCNERPVTYTEADLDFICQVDPTRVFPDNNCNSFFNCSSPPDAEGRFLQYQNECPYFQLYDRETKMCKPVTEVKCNMRPEIKYPCNLRQFSCGRGQHCRPCYVDYPDCTTLPDGDQPYPDQLYTPYYARCSQGRSLAIAVPGNLENLVKRDFGTGCSYYSEAVIATTSFTLQRIPAPL
nr:hypothetical protein BaRGS_005974 [Batillaria attramentaria]